MPASTGSTRQRIVEAADELFYRQGITATSVDAVVQLAGLSKPTLYRYFPSKDDLIEAYLGARDRTSRDLIEATIAAQTDPVDRLLSVFDWLDTWHSEPSFRGCSFARTASELELQVHGVAAAIRERKRWLRFRLNQLATDAGIPVPVQFSDAMMLLIEGATTTAFVEGDRHAARKARRVARALITMFKGSDE